MLDPDEEAAVADRFGVALPQVRRDHLISHLLAALSTYAADQVIFFGGTALSRTFAPDGRLSEDIDLIAIGQRRVVARVLEQELLRATRREFPGLRWEPLLTTVRDTEPAALITSDGLSVRVQLLGSEGYPPWPTSGQPLLQRYSDAPPATLTVPTAAAFAAAKTVAWVDRAASRDLYDLWLLAQSGSVTAEAAQLFTRHGPTNKPPTAGTFARPPDEATWRRDLSAQTRLIVTAREALAVVADAWQAVT
jgi:hypothetical protein